MAWSFCDKCGKRTGETVLWQVRTANATHSSPAEYEWRCLRPGCAPAEERDEAYERAANRYDGANGERDWR
jgi:hypothetical protein